MDFTLRLLAESEIERIEQRALAILNEMGVAVTNEALAAQLGKRGARVEGRIVRLAPELVRQALKVAPRDVTLYGRGPDYRVLPLKPGHCILSTYGEAIKVSDYGATELRPSTRQDVVNFVRLGQAMPEIDNVNPVCFARDLPEPVQLLRTAEITVTYSNKHHTVAPLSLEEARMWWELVQIAGPGRETAPYVSDLSANPTVSFVVSTTSPLQFDHDTAEVLMFAAAQRIPFIAASCPMAGGTSPLALIGTIVQHLAEDLFLLTAAQMLNEGTPVVIGGAAGILDMRTGALSYGAPERHLLLGAVIELAEHYGLPHHSPAGSVDAWYPDVQAGADKMQCWMARLLKRTMWGVAFGSVYNGAAVSLEQMLIDADLWRQAEQFFAGIHMDELDASCDAIRRVGIGGNFLADEQTRRLMRSKEMYLSRLANREGDQGRSMVDRAHQQAERLLAQPGYTAPEATRQEIARYADEKAAQYMGRDNR